MKAKQKHLRENEDNYFINQVHKMMQQDHCVLCNRKISSAPRSHVVPQFVLRNISENGEICFGHALSKKEVPGLPKITGISNAYTFKLLCEECEGSCFKKYENPNNLLNYENLPLDIQKKMLYEMAVKAHLARINMKYEVLVSADSASQGLVKQYEENGILSPARIDMISCFNVLSRLKRTVKNKKDPFLLLYNKLLDYQIKIATQTLICYIFDLRGNRVFNDKDLSLDNESRYFYLMVLPLKEKTRIFFYIEKRDAPYVESIINDFTKMSNEDKLHFLFVSLVIHSQQFYIAKSLADYISKHDKQLINLYTKTDPSYFQLLFGIDNRSKIKNFKKYSNYFSKRKLT